MCKQILEVDWSVFGCVNHCVCRPYVSWTGCSRPLSYSISWCLTTQHTIFSLNFCVFHEQVEEKRHTILITPLNSWDCSFICFVDCFLLLAMDLISGTCAWTLISWVFSYVFVYFFVFDCVFVCVYVCICLCLWLKWPGTISGGMRKEIQDTTTKRPEGR